MRLGAGRRAGWLPACAAGAAAGIAGVALTEGPLLAKAPEKRQEVYVWGRSQAVPGGSSRDLLRPQRMEWFESHDAAWEKLAFGPTFGAALDCQGRLFVWGETKSSAAVGPLAVAPQGALRKARVLDVQCSSTKVFILTSAGVVLVVEDMVSELTRHREGSAPRDSIILDVSTIPGLPRPSRMAFWGTTGVKQMAIGLEHGAFVSHKGELYCVGNSTWGQCGTEPERPKGPMGALEERPHIEILTPQLVELPEEAGRIVFAAVGGRHTVAQDETGKTFAFGDDRRIQLGLGETRTSGNDDRHAYGVLHRDHLGGVRPNAEIKRQVVYKYYDPHMQATPVATLLPRAYNRPEYPPPMLLACGEDYSLALHRDSPDWYSKEQETHMLFCCGENAEGQCGRNLQQQQQVWLPVRLPKRSKTDAIACGQAHSLALQSNGDLFAWGANREGQVGNGGRAAVVQPAKLHLGPDVQGAGQPQDEPRRRVVSIACGFRNSAAICEVPVAP